VADPRLPAPPAEPLPTSAVATERIARASRVRTLLPSMSGKLLTGLVIVGVIVLFGLVAPAFVQDPRDSGNPALLPPGPDHLLGTTKLGYDVFAQLAWGTQGSLGLALRRPRRGRRLAAAGGRLRGARRLLRGRAR